MTLAVASVGECMLELSGHTGDIWRMGFAGDTLNTLWTMRALSPGHHVDYVSAFGDDPFSQGADRLPARPRHRHCREPDHCRRPSRALCDHADRRRNASFTYWRSDAAARRLASDAAGLAKSLANRALDLFLRHYPWQFWTRRPAYAARRDCRRARQKARTSPSTRIIARGSGPTAAKLAPRSIAALGVMRHRLPTQARRAELFGDADIAATLARLEAAGIAEIVVKKGDGAGAGLLTTTRRSKCRRVQVADPGRHDGCRRCLQRRLSLAAGWSALRRPRRPSAPIAWRRPWSRCAAHWRHRTLLKIAFDR